MRRALGFILLGLGVFVLALGLLLRFYAYPALAKVPLNIKSTSVAEGQGATALVFVKKGDRDVPEIRDNLHLVSTTRVVGSLTEAEGSEEGTDVAVWVEATIVEAKDAPELQPLSGSERQLCIDRHTGEAHTPCTSQYYLDQLKENKDPETLRVKGDKDVPQQPGYSFKLPFNTEKKTYPFYNHSLKKSKDCPDCTGTVPLRFEAEDAVKGLDVYRFAYSVEPTIVDKDRPVPGSLVGKPKVDTVKVDLYYKADRTMWIDPVTGAVIALEQTVDQRLVQKGQQFEDGTVVSDATLRLNDETVNNNITSAEENRSQLWLLTTLPIILWVAGPILMLIGLLLLIRRQRPEAPVPARGGPRTRVGAGA